MPVGQTDSEKAFCWLLNQLEQRFPTRPDSLDDVVEELTLCCDELRKLGVFNLLLSDGDYVFSYCTNHLYWITRRAPFGKASLIDEDVTINFQEETTPHDVVTVVATQPLTLNEQWTRLKPGEYALFYHGEKVSGNSEQLLDVAYAEAKPGNQAPSAM
jgi:glutamine amidotransferase